MEYTNKFSLFSFTPAIVSTNISVYSSAIRMMGKEKKSIRIYNETHQLEFLLIGNKTCKKSYKTSAAFFWSGHPTAIEKKKPRIIRKSRCFYTIGR